MSLFIESKLGPSSQNWNTPNIQITIDYNTIHKTNTAKYMLILKRTKWLNKRVEFSMQKDSKYISLVFRLSKTVFDLFSTWVHVCVCACCSVPRRPETVLLEEVLSCVCSKDWIQVFNCTYQLSHHTDLLMIYETALSQEIEFCSPRLPSTCNGNLWKCRVWKDITL